jgi:hypothetical protein
MDTLTSNEILVLGFSMWWKVMSAYWWVALIPIVIWFWAEIKHFFQKILDYEGKK